MPLFNVQLYLKFSCQSSWQEISLAKFKYMSISSNVPRELGRFLGDVSGMAEYVTSRESVLFCRHSSCWMLRMGPNKWKRVSIQSKD